MLTPQGFVTTESRQKAPPVSELQPHSFDAETALLGALVLDPAQFLEVGYLQKSDFYLLNNGILFDSMKTLFEWHGGYDWLTVIEYLRSKGHLDSIGGEVVLSDLVNATPVSYGAPEYANIIYKHSVRRQQINAGLKIVQAAYDVSQDIAPDDLVNQAIDTLAAIDASRNISSGPQPISAGVNRMIDRLEQLEANNSIIGLSTGLKTLDCVFGGLDRDKFYLLAGRPGMGKSGLALQIAQNVCSRGTPVLYFALEMSADAIADRLTSSLCNVPYETFRRPGVNRLGDVLKAADHVSKLPLIVDCTPGLSAANIRSIAQKTMLKYPLGLVIIDHGGLVRPEKRTGNPYSDQSQNADDLMALPKQLGVPVLALLQLSRAIENRQDKRPQMHDLRDSGKWEENADAIMFMYRDEVYNPDTEFPKLGEIGIDKNRGGKRGNFTIYANVATNRFADLETRIESL